MNGRETKTLQYEGEVEFGNSSRTAFSNDSLGNGAVHIGGEDILEDIDESLEGKEVLVKISTPERQRPDRYKGESDITIGWGYSEVTPVESDSFLVGGEDIIDIIDREFDEGEEVILEVQGWAKASQEEKKRFVKDEF